MIRATVQTDTTGLRAVANSTRRRAITAQALRAGTRILRPAVKALAPKANKSGGTLKRSITAKVRKGKYAQTVSLAVVGPKYGPKGKRRNEQAANYAHLVELGTRAHSLAKGSRLARVKKVKVLDAQQVAIKAQIEAEKAELRARLTKLVAQGRIPADRLKSLGQTGPRKRRPKKPNIDIGQDRGRKHPGARRHPFLKPAYESTKAEVGQAVARAMVDLVTKEITKQAQRILAKQAKRAK